MKRIVCLKCIQKIDKNYHRDATRLCGVCEICNGVSSVAEMGEQKFQDLIKKSKQ